MLRMKSLQSIDGLVKLPLYDWPEFHEQTDFIWAAIRQAAREEGLDLPVDLDHQYQRLSATMEETLVFSQLCGSPWSRHYSASATYLATCDFDVKGNTGGHYFSQIVVAESASFEGLSDLKNATFAFNDDDSQSGVHCTRPLFETDALVAAGVETGGHRMSMEAVAEGRADFAAIDAFSHSLAERTMPDVTKQLRIIGQTPLRPAPVLITATSLGPAVGQAMKNAVMNAVSSLPSGIRETYGQRGVVRLDEEDYSIFALDRAARPD